MSAAGVVVAAGAGDRFGGAKHAVEIGGLAIWKHARNTLAAAGVDPVIVVGPVPGGVAGGPLRRDSVLAGLRELPSDTRYVLVHDAARPAASVSLAVAVLNRLEQGDVDAVVPGVPMVDTVKRVIAGKVVSTLSRDELIRVQTPQGFVLSVLLEAHAAISGDVSDDAALVEAFGASVAVVEGDPENVKLTYPSDLALLERTMRERS